MKTRGGAMLRALLVVALVIAAVVQFVRSIQLGDKEIGRLLGGHTPTQSAPAPRPAPASAPPTTLSGLSCFACHNIGRYHKGKKFPHDVHKKEGLYHCHHCHVFSGHMQVSIRKDTCSECHDK